MFTLLLSVKLTLLQQNVVTSRYVRHCVVTPRYVDTVLSRYVDTDLSAWSVRVVRVPTDHVIVSTTGEEQTTVYRAPRDSLYTTLVTF